MLQPPPLTLITSPSPEADEQAQPHQPCSSVECKRPPVVLPNGEPSAYATSHALERMESDLLRWWYDWGIGKVEEIKIASNEIRLKISATLGIQYAGPSSNTEPNQERYLQRRKMLEYAGFDIVEHDLIIRFTRLLDTPKTRQAIRKLLSISMPSSKVTSFTTCAMELLEDAPDEIDEIVVVNKSHEQVDALSTQPVIDALTSFYGLNHTPCVDGG